ncbi:MAG: hypothetical protein R2838_18700 [Caldilineaceae bacterium]
MTRERPQMSSSRADFPADSVTEYVAALAAPTPARRRQCSRRHRGPRRRLMAMAAAITVRRTSPMPAATDLTRRRSGSRGQQASAGLAVADSAALEALLAARRAGRAGSWNQRRTPMPRWLRRRAR